MPFVSLSVPSGPPHTTPPHPKLGENVNPSGFLCRGGFLVGALLEGSSYIRWLFPLSPRVQFQSMQCLSRHSFLAASLLLRQELSCYRIFPHPCDLAFGSGATYFFPEAKDTTRHTHPHPPKTRREDRAREPFFFLLKIFLCVFSCLCFELCFRFHESLRIAKCFKQKSIVF